MERNFRKLSLLIHQRKKLSWFSSNFSLSNPQLCNYFYLRFFSCLILANKTEDNHKSVNNWSLQLFALNIRQASRKWPKRNNRKLVTISIGTNILLCISSILLKCLISCRSFKKWNCQNPSFQLKNKLSSNKTTPTKQNYLLAFASIHSPWKITV